MTINKIIGIIPARLNSTRVPRKPLVDICGIPMCIHVYRRASFCSDLDDLVIATDSQEVVNIAIDLGAKAVLTKAEHKNGTERMAEVIRKTGHGIAVLINGDEALLRPEHITESIGALTSSVSDASMLARKYTKNNSFSDFKLALNLRDEVMYISRGDIPCSARNPAPYMLKAYHIMTFWRQTLLRYSGLEKTPLECIEDHEHLRLLEHGMKIKARVVDSTSISVDTYDDLKFVRSEMKHDHLFALYR